MSNAIIFIDDNINRLDKLLLSVQSVFCIANRKNLENAPQNNDMEICILQILRKDVMADNNRFSEIKRMLEARQQNTIGMPEILLKYDTQELDFHDYPQNCNLLYNTLKEKIEKISTDYDTYYILLDISLYDERDIFEVMSGNKILSQLIYDGFADNCMPYTSFDSDGKEFILKWRENVSKDTEPYERYRLESNAVYKPFRDKLYKQFQIGEYN